MLDLVSDEGSHQPCVGTRRPLRSAVPVGVLPPSSQTMPISPGRGGGGSVWVLRVCAPASQPLDPREASPSELGFRVTVSWAPALPAHAGTPLPGPALRPQAAQAGPTLLRGDVLHLPVLRGAVAGHEQRGIKTSDRAERKPFAMSP